MKKQVQEFNNFFKDGGLWPYYDFVHDPYRPIESTKNKFLSDALFNNSLVTSKFEDKLLRIKDSIGGAIGRWNTIWGVKFYGKKISWELYFYTHRIPSFQIAAEALIQALQSNIQIPFLLRSGIRKQPYFMFSVDISNQILELNSINCLHLYIDGMPRIKSSASYNWGINGISHENYYYFYGMPNETSELIEQLKSNPIINYRYKYLLSHNLVKRLMACKRIYLADKHDKIGIYFSRVNVAQFIVFLEHFSYPRSILDFVRSNRKNLNHLLYDVAFNCSITEKGMIFKDSSYYGVF